MELRKTFRFEASHVLPKHPGKCSRLHGHSWVLHVYVEGLINPNTGFVMDYADISGIVKPLIEMLDHRHLGNWEYVSIPNNSWCVVSLPVDFYPTSENLLVWIGRQLAGRLDWSKLQLEETCTSLATLERSEFDGEETITGGNVDSIVGRIPGQKA